MHTIWLKDAKTQEAKVARKKELMSYRNAFDEARAVLSREFEELPTPDYDSPSWAYKQADILGANRMLQHILKILDIKE